MVSIADAATLLTADEVAKLTGLAQSTIRRFANTGQIAHVRVSRKSLRFTPEQVREWIERRSVGSTSQTQEPTQEKAASTGQKFLTPRAER